MKSIAKKITSANIKQVDEIKAAADEILQGSTLILIDGKIGGITVDLKKFDVRAIAEPPTELAIRGPRNGFIESIKTNLSLVRRYLKTPSLKIEMLQVGKYTSTAVALMSIDGITDDKLTDKIRKKLQSIDIDGIPDSSYLTKMLNERKNSLFKQIGSTERPDVLIERMLEGRVGILVDGSPFALTLPYMLIEDFQTAEDYYISHYRANLVRTLRVFAIFFSVFLPGLFVAAELFHLQLIPLNFLLTIVNSIKGIPLSPSLEMFFILLIFEILNETSIRMPKYVGMALAIVGALVLGENALSAYHGNVRHQYLYRSGTYRNDFALKIRRAYRRGICRRIRNRTYRGFSCMLFMYDGKLRRTLRRAVLAAYSERFAGRHLYVGRHVYAVTPRGVKAKEQEETKCKRKIIFAYARYVSC